MKIRMDRAHRSECRPREDAAMDGFSVLCQMTGAGRGGTGGAIPKMHISKVCWFWVSLLAFAKLLNLRLLHTFSHHAASRAYNWPATQTVELEDGKRNEEGKGRGGEGVVEKLNLIVA